MENIFVKNKIARRKDLYWFGIHALVEQAGGLGAMLEQISIAREQHLMTDLQAFTLRELVYDVERHFRIRNNEDRNC